MRKRFLAMLLSVAMVLTMLPVAAFAADGDVPEKLTVTLDPIDGKTGKDITADPVAAEGSTTKYFLTDDYPTAAPNDVSTYTDLPANVSTEGVTVDKKYVCVAHVNGSNITHWGATAVTAVEETENDFTATLNAKGALAVTFKNQSTPDSSEVKYLVRDTAFVTAPATDDATLGGTLKASSEYTTTANNVAVGSHIAAAVYESDSFSYWSTGVVEAGYVTLSIAKENDTPDAKVEGLVAGANDVKDDAAGTLKVDKTVEGISFNVKMAANYKPVVKNGDTVVAADVETAAEGATTYTHNVTVAADALDNATALTVGSAEEDVVVVKSIDTATISTVEDDEANTVTAGGAVEPTLGGATAIVPLTVTTTADTTIPTVTMDPSGAIDGATVEPTENDKEWTVTVPYTGPGIMNIKLATSATIPAAEGLTVTAVPKDGDETKLTLTLQDGDTTIEETALVDYVYKTVTGDSALTEPALGADVSTGYTDLTALEIDAKSGTDAITKVLVVKKNAGDRALRAGVATVGAPDPDLVPLTLTITREKKDVVKVAAQDNADPANTITGFKADISAIPLSETNWTTVKDTITTAYNAATGLTTGIAGKGNVNVMKEDGNILYWGTAVIPAWVEATIDADSGITLKSGSSLSFAYADGKNSIIVEVTGDVVPAVLMEDGTENTKYSFVKGANDYTLALEEPTSDLTLRIGAKPAATETKTVTLKWSTGSGITVTDSEAVNLESGEDIPVPATGSAVYNISAAGKKITTNPVTLPAGITLAGTAAEGYTLTIDSTVTASVVIELEAKTETESKNVTAVAVTLNTDGLKVGSTLPNAATTTEGAAVTTIWTNSKGEKVTTAAAAGTYTAELTVSVEDGYILAGDATFTLNGKTVTVEELTATVEITDDAASDDGDNVATGETTVTGDKVTGSVKEEAVSDAIDAATKDPDKDDVVLDFTATGGSAEINSAEVTIPAESVKEVNEGELKLTVKTPVATVGLGAEAVSEIAKGAAPEAGKKVSIVLTVEEPENNPAAGSDKKEAQAFEIKFEKIVANADGSNPSAPTPVAIRKSVTLTLKTTVEPPTDSSWLIAIFVDGSKQSIVNPRAKYDRDARTATFTVNHLSTYMLKASLAEEGEKPDLLAADGTPLGFVNGKKTIKAGEPVVFPAGVDVTNTFTDGCSYQYGAFVLDPGVTSGTVTFYFGGTGGSGAAGGIEYTYVVVADDAVKQAKVGTAFKKLYIDGLTSGEVVVFVINSHSKFPGKNTALYLTTVANTKGEASVIVNDGETGGVAFVYPVGTTEVIDANMAPAKGYTATHVYTLLEVQK